MDPYLLTLLLLLFLASLVAVATVHIFRTGARDEFVTAKPFRSLIFWTLGLQACLWLRDWLASDLAARSLGERLGIGVLAFIALAAIWSAGFFYGRWRRERRAGRLSGARSR